jgi:hypothetical protein
LSDGFEAYAKAACRVSSFCMLVNAMTVRDFGIKKSKGVWAPLQSIGIWIKRKVKRKVK